MNDDLDALRARIAELEQAHSEKAKALERAYSKLNKAALNETAAKLAMQYGLKPGPTRDLGNRLADDWRFDPATDSWASRDGYALDFGAYIERLKLETQHWGWQKVADSEKRQSGSDRELAPDPDQMSMAQYRQWRARLGREPKHPLVRESRSGK